MSKRAEQICDALVALFDEADIAEEFDVTLGAERSYVRLSDLSGVGESVVVVVAPQMTVRERTSNGTYARYVVVDILVLAHLTSDASADRTTMDGRAELLEDIDNYLANAANADLTLSGGDIAQYVEPTDSRADPEIRKGLGILYDVGDLTEKRQVTGLVRAAYVVNETY